MALAKRIFLFYFLFVALCGYFMLNLFSNEIYPSVRQTTEETLVDTANLLAVLVAEDMRAGKINQQHLQAKLLNYKQRDPFASIWGVVKHKVDLRVYITDDKGIVLFDSTGHGVGADYSRWRDVHLTLKGMYGARTTQENPNDESSTIMYVAAPIKDASDHIIGVLTVAKPNATVTPYIHKAQSRLMVFGAILVAIGLFVGALLSWWLGASLRHLTRYAESVSKGERVKVPTFYGGELTQLARALDKMRVELDGKQYVERYVQTLTHELKSPLAAIRGAVELLQQEMPLEKRQHFLKNIDFENGRLQQLVDRLLSLSMVEQLQTLEDIQSVVVADAVQQLVMAKSSQIILQQAQLDIQIPKTAVIKGDPFLLQQAFSNILDNALDFMTKGGVLAIHGQQKDRIFELRFFNQGVAIPEYALGRLCERFYSLPRPVTRRKSTGLGLNFVQEVMDLHQGALSIVNHQEGVLVTLSFPLNAAV